MWTVLCAKAVCNISFVEKLASTNGKHIVEASRDDNYLGSGLSISLSETTKPDYFPEGSNMLGNLLMHLRTEVVAYHYTDQNIIEKSQAKPENEQYTAPPSAEINKKFGPPVGSRYASREVGMPDTNFTPAQSWYPSCHSE